MNRVTAFVDAHQNLYFSSHLFSGMWTLAERGEIELEMVHPAGRDRKYSSDPAVPFFRIESEDGRTRIMCISTYDRSDFLRSDLLEMSDVCFMRSYYRPHLRLLTPHLRQRIAPLGLHFSCRRAEMHSAIMWSVVPRYLLRSLCGPLRWKRRLAHDWNMFRTYLHTPYVADVQQGPDTQLERAVVYQTRVWSPDETTDDTDAINGQRVQLVRALRKAFGSRFHGGITPTPYARRHYPDVLTDQPSERGSYLAMARRHLVGVYSRGLHYSIGGKLAEYLAASMCVVTDPLRNELPTPLLRERNCLFFNDADECVEHCARLLEDPQLAAEMRRANHEYYLRHVEPGALMRSCIERALRCPPQAHETAQRECAIATGTAR